MSGVQVGIRGGQVEFYGPLPLWQEVKLNNRPSLVFCVISGCCRQLAAFSDEWQEEAQEVAKS